MDWTIRVALLVGSIMGMVSGNILIRWGREENNALWGWLGWTGIIGGTLSIILFILRVVLELQPE